MKKGSLDGIMKESIEIGWKEKLQAQNQALRERITTDYLRQIQGTGHLSYEQVRRAWKYANNLSSEELKEKLEIYNKEK